MMCKLAFLILFFSFSSNSTNFLTLFDLSNYINNISKKDINFFECSRFYDAIKHKKSLAIDLKQDYKIIDLILKNLKVKEKFFIFICHLGLKDIKIVNAEIFKNNIIEKFFTGLKSHSSSYALNSISLLCNNLNTVPESIFLFTELKELNLAFNNLVIIPNDILKLSNLKTMNLDNNQLLNFPEILLKMNRLKLLYLIDNPLNTNLLIDLKTSFAIIFEEPLIEESTTDEESSTISLESLLDEEDEERVEFL